MNVEKGTPPSAIRHVAINILTRRVEAVCQQLWDEMTASPNPIDFVKTKHVIDIEIKTEKEDG